MDDRNKKSIHNFGEKSTGRCKWENNNKHDATVEWMKMFAVTRKMVSRVGNAWFGHDWSHCNSKLSHAAPGDI